MSKEIDEAKKLLNSNGYLVLKMTKGCVNCANICEIDQFNINNEEGSCMHCINKTCLKDIIINQLA